MDLRRDFYKDIKRCQKCDGFGVINRTEPSYKFKYCDECEGFGTYIDEPKGRIVFGLPLFVDYATRKKLATSRVILIAGSVIVIILVSIILFWLS